MYCVLIQHYFFSQIPTFCVFCAICAFFKAQRKFKLYQGKTGSVLAMTLSQLLILR